MRGVRGEASNTLSGASGVRTGAGGGGWGQIVASAAALRNANVAISAEYIREGPPAMTP